MLLVVDFNVVFSALVNNGIPYKVFRANALLSVFDFVAPIFFKEELTRRWSRIVSFSKLPDDEFSLLLNSILDQIIFVPDSLLLPYLEESKKLNLKDAPYLALAISLDCSVMSGDKELKTQSRVKVLSPSEVLALIYKLS